MNTIIHNFNQMSIKTIALIAAGYFILAGTFFLTASSEITASLVITKFLFLIPYGIALIILFQTAARESKDKKNYLLICLFTGYALLYLAIIFITFIPQTNFLPGYAAAYHWIRLASFIFLIAGWFFTPFMQQRERLRLKLLLDITITIGSIALLGWVVFMQPINRSSLIHPQPWQWIQIHPILDLAIGTIALNLLLINPNRIARWILATVVLTQILIFAFDLNTTAPIVDSGNSLVSLDLGSMLMACLLFFFSVLISRNAKLITRPEPDQSPWAFGLQLQSTLPIALPIVLAAILSAAWVQNQVVSQSATGFTTMIWLLLITRLGVSAGEFELQQYYFLYTNSTEPAFICDRKLNLILVNPAMIQICRADQESDLIGTPICNWINEQPALSVNKELHREVTLKCLDGSSLVADLSLKSIQLGIFKRRLITGAIHDLTDINQQRAELQQANQRLSELMRKVEQFNQELELRVQEKTSSLTKAYDELAEKNLQLESLDELKSDFVSLVSHELRAPLTNISGGMELVLSDHHRLPASIHQSLELVQQEIKRLTRFVESILDLSALDAGRMPLYPEPLDMGPIIHELQDQFNQYPGARRIKWDFPAIIPPVMADSRALYSVIFHLVDNALKYAPEGEILFSLRPEVDKIVFTVQDRGPGVPIDKMDYIFDDFYRGDPADSQTVYGHGLGLYIVRRFLQAMDGEIDVSNRPGGGAEFRCWLPMMEVDHETENPDR